MERLIFLLQFLFYFSQYQLASSSSNLLISYNSPTGEIPSSICNLISLEILDLSHNSFGGAIPQCLGNFSSRLSVLNLQSNRFQGPIPATFVGDNLRNLDLNGNQLEGPLPRSLSNCKSLEVLDLGNNEINDTFPNWLGSLPSLQVLVLRSNRFHGPIGNFIQKFPFPKLRIIDLSYNNFAGELPRRYFGNLNAMKNKTMGDKRYMGDGYYQDSVIVTMKGQEIEMVRIFTVFTAIDLSSNNFVGEIPEDIQALISLIVLNFSHNSLTGNIPSYLGDVASLESLDLCHNQLTGKIPSELTSLTFLAVFNVSWNRLVGLIPLGNQFNTFEYSSYAGNSGLCGPPVSNRCGDYQAEPGAVDQSEDDLDFASGFTWQVVVIGFGCGTTLGFFTGCLMFLTGRPKFFVTIVERIEYKKVKRFRELVTGKLAKDIGKI